MPNKAKEMCIKRQCTHADMPPPPVVVTPESKWHINVGGTIEDDSVEIEVAWINEKTGDFHAQIIRLTGTLSNRFGNYVTEGQYYHFKRHTDDDPEEILWEIPEEGTDLFHKEGSTGSQFLLYWFKDTGFSFDLDS